MILRVFAALVASWLLCLAPVGVAAQTATEPGVETAEEEASWERIAQRAEQLAARDDASEFALNRLRAELVSWRDIFLARTSINAGRIATVEAQLAALGAVPDSGEESELIGQRRAALEAQLQELIAPRLLAEEAYARANGLIGEFDAQLLQRQTAALTERGPTPLNPAHAAGAVAALWDLVQVIGVETSARTEQQWGAGRLIAGLPRAILLFLVALACLGLFRRRLTAWRQQVRRDNRRFAPVWLFILSLAQLLIPTIGLVALSEALTTLDIFGLRGDDVVEALPEAGFVVLFAWWLSRLIFPVGADAGYLGHDIRTRASGRRYSLALGWMLALWALMSNALQTMDIDPGPRAAIDWPLMVIMGVLLWRFGSVLRTKPEPIPGEIVSEGRVRGLIGRFCTIAAVAAPVAAAFGFGAAGAALLIPALSSLGLAGVVLLVQRVLQDVTTPRATDEAAKGFAALLPVFLSFVIYLISLPVFALIWGVRVDDLIEIWTRFREGFALGETRISPTDFLAFILVFAIGYLLTRFIQGTLRRSVMPRTRLDIGGQNAIVAGFGYVGIILAAIIAITSAGIDLSNIALVAGALSVGIGFGLQNIVSNFVSGIILLIERPVSEGDWIEVGGQMGYVRAISVRSTRIETFDRTDVIVPNADLVSGQVTNWTRGNLVGRVIVPVGVAYGSDVDKVTEILRGIAEAHPQVVMTPPPAVLFQGFGADSLDFEIRAILRDVNYVLTVKSEMNHAIAKEFAAAGIEIPFAQRDIWLRNPEALKGETA
ncbi:DUF3772 domain-containing protein [Cognatiyoonia sp. IB215446]|uniref:DUF3772 domain-containing protein n=1 Tax=Cognatiyoonia sp. IB215446 TaxID=3097355 RepID=UPI002A0D8A79|nr:DUF3772 domain-containing protein [Cognatiyoonia sp. IB215446]MDX8348884.1 DUF3772 domain-containing protein [Cognatiyoonia sp. IB215446]